MKKYLLLSLLLCLFATLCACSSKGSTASSLQPEWVTKPSSSYQEKDFITGLGHADTRIKAENAAYQALANYIIQDISVNTTTSSQTQISASNLNQSQYIEQEMVSTSNIKQIAGLSIKETWFDTHKTYYALAVLNKTEAASYYADKIRANILNIEDLRAIAKKNASSFESNKAYNTALILAKENEEYLVFMTTLDNARRKLLEAQNISSHALLAEQREDAKNIRLAVHVSGQESKNVENYIIAAFAQKGIQAQLAQNIANPQFLFECHTELTNLPDQGLNKFISYKFTANLKDIKNQQSINSSYQIGRAGHATRGQAIERALMSLQEYILTEDFF